MNDSKTIRVLFSEEDRERLEPILDRLKASGLRTAEADGTLRKTDTVLAVLSENFCRDRVLTDKLLTFVGSGAENILPLQLDPQPLPDELKNALYSRNIIPAADRDASLIAERVIAALPKRKSRLPLILSLAGILLLAVIAVMVIRAFQPKGPASPDSGEVIDVTFPSNTDLTLEDLAEVRCVVIVGEHFSWYTNETRLTGSGGSGWPDMLYELADFDRGSDPNGFTWYWHEDGSEVSMTSYDLRFLSYMPNLEELHMAKVDIDEAPDLSGSERLGVVWAYDCRMDDLNWLADSKIRKAQLRCDVDFSPLTGCGSLRCLLLDVFRDEYADLSSFSPPSLQELDLMGWDIRSADLSGLASCKGLMELRLHELPVEDISFLQQTKKISRLQLSGLYRLQDISVLSSLTGLQFLEIDDCESITDYSPIAGCRALREISIDARNTHLTDTSFLGALPELASIRLHFDRLNDLDFLKPIGEKNKIISFEFAGRAGDYSGLSAVKVYNRLEIDPGEDNLDQILGLLEDVTATQLQLGHFRTVDLSALPRVTSQLVLYNCGLTDLSTLPEDLAAMEIRLESCSALRSLEGLQHSSRFGKNGAGTLELYNCPLLEDWSAVEEMNLYSLEIAGSFSLPSFADLHVTKLRLDRIEDITDLEFLNDMDAGSPCSFELIGLDGVMSLAPLRRFHGSFLAVGPQHEEQAKDLVKAGNFDEYRIEYPQGGWELDLSALELNSLEDLDELPKALLKRIDQLYIAGDRIYDPDLFELREDWEHKKSANVPTLLLCSRETGELIPVGDGIITDVGIFSELTGLHDLHLYAQPLTDLNGIQSLYSLHHFCAKFCPELSDASALFTLQGLEIIELNNTAIHSIQGIQNLHRLWILDISWTKVEDLSPLAGCSTDYAEANGGFRLNFNDLHPSGMEALGTIRCYSNLSFSDIDPAVWLPVLADSQIFSFGASGDLQSNEGVAALAENHPELRSLYIGRDDRITDLTPLLALENLEHVSLYHGMKKAIQSLDGQSCSFELELTD